MPRTLPWLAGGSSKKEKARKAASEQKSHKRSPSPHHGDLIDSDLEPIGSGASSPRHKPTKQPRREPSSSPPPQAKAAPTVEYMREGFTMDDRYIMVEDEFFSTAQLFTAPLHRQEYDRIKRLARSRGSDTLKAIRHGTDVQTAKSKVLRMRMEAEENAKKRKAAGVVESDGSDDEDEFMADPQLAGLMTASQLTPKKSLRGFASQSQRTPQFGSGRTRDALGKHRQNTSIMAGDEETDDDDLDAGAAPPTATETAFVKQDMALGTPRASIEQAQTSKKKHVGIFKQFAKSAQLEPKERPKDKGKEKEKQKDKTRTSSPIPIGRSPVRAYSQAPPLHRPSAPASTNGDAASSAALSNPKISRTAMILARTGRASQIPEKASPAEHIKQECESQLNFKEEPTSPTQHRAAAKREPLPSSVKHSSTSKFFAQSRAERARKEAHEKNESRVDEIPTFLF